jgi:hypothetical protein
MTSATSPSRILEITKAYVEEESSRLFRRTRLAMVGESVLIGALSAAGIIAVLGSTAETATVAGFTLGLPQFIALGVAAVAMLLALPNKLALRRVALVKAISFAALFVAGAVYYPAGAWAVNMPGALLAAAVALAGMAEFILIGSANFVSEPSAPATEDR